MSDPSPQRLSPPPAPGDPPAEAMPVASPRSADEPRTPVNILLVDDNPSKLLALETALAPLGEHLVMARSGAEALRELLAREFAVIILDVSMPVMDGFETARMIRGRPRSADTPIIFASAINLSEADSLRGYALGAVDYILAPIIPEVLRAKASVFVELYRRTQEAQRHAQELEERTRQLQASQLQLRMAERMASLGTLAAGLGHDMGNLLLPLQTRLSALDGESLSDEARDCLAAVSTSVGYLRRLASGLRLLALAPGEDEQANQATGLAPWWHEVEPMLRNALPRSVNLQSDLPNGLPPVLIAKHLLTQAVFNLVQNAGEVLRPSGSGRVMVSASSERNTVVLRISDNGPGMTPEVRQRCLEPFYTTKSRTLSTGLGLAMVNGIIERVGGSLDVESAPGKGTTFICHLPARVRPGEGRRLVARLAVGDQRRRAVITGLLRIHGVEVAPETGADAVDADVLVCEAEGAEPGLTTFLEQQEHGRVLYLGTTDAADPRIVPVASSGGVTALRTAIASLVRRKPNGAQTATLPAGQPVGNAAE